jgi:hypothetical protein
MSKTSLRERVARTVYYHWPDATKAADAAIALVIEEAARVAESEANSQGDDDDASAWRIYASILQLKENKP